MARFLNNHSLLAGVPLLAFLALLGLLLLASSARAANIHLQTDSEGWHRGRATYFGASPELVETFERVRGAGSYGDLHYGSCGMYRKPQVRSAFWVVEKKKGNQREEREKNERRGKKTRRWPVLEDLLHQPPVLVALLDDEADLFLLCVCACQRELTVMMGEKKGRV